MRSCSNCCVGARHGSISRSRNGTGWTRASVLPSVDQPGGPQAHSCKSSSTSDRIQPTRSLQGVLPRRIPAEKHSPNHYLRTKYCYRNSDMPTATSPHCQLWSIPSASTSSFAVIPAINAFEFPIVHGPDGGLGQPASNGTKLIGVRRWFYAEPGVGTLTMACCDPQLASPSDITDYLSLPVGSVV